MRHLLLTLLFAGLLATPAEAAKRGSCARPDTETVAKNRQVRVFERSARSAGAQYDTRLLACLRATGRTVRLDQAYDDGYVLSYGYDNVALAGRFVAWSSRHTDDSCKAACPPDYEATTYSVSVRDLRRRRTRTIAVDEAPSTVTVTRAGEVSWR